MRAALNAQPAVLRRLRQVLGALEGQSAPARGGVVSLGAAAVDEVLGGGLARGALHEIAAASEAEMAAATGFALALAVRAARLVVWIAEDMALGESGVPYGPGLDDLGLAPEHLVLVAAPKPREVFWAVEEALQCSGIGTVIGEIRSKRVHLNTTRRLSLAAGRRGGLALLLRCAPDPEASAATTRWIVTAAPSDVADPMLAGPGPPRFALLLTRNRRGRPGCWELEWNGVRRCFDLASAYREPLAQAALHRPRQRAST
jgi:protein ImuA